MRHVMCAPGNDSAPHAYLRGYHGTSDTPRRGTARPVARHHASRAAPMAARESACEETRVPRPPQWDPASVPHRHDARARHDWRADSRNSRSTVNETRLPPITRTASRVGWAALSTGSASSRIRRKQQFDVIVLNAARPFIAISSPTPTSCNAWLRTKGRNERMRLMVLHPLKRIG